MLKNIVPPSLVTCLKDFKNFEVIHYYDSLTGDLIAQKGNMFSYKMGVNIGSFECNLEFKYKIFTPLRITRRLARLDKGTCLYLKKLNKIFCIYQGSCYSYDIEKKHLEFNKQFDFRNPLFLGTTIVNETSVIFGEYFSNKNMRSVRIFRSDDAGKNIHTVYEFPANSIWHVHGVYFDKFTGNYWICTGDYDGQCRIVMVDSDFKEIETYGDGTQSWRAVSMFFLEDRVVWGMDSPLSPCHVMSLNRKTGKLSKGQSMPGPVWYSKHLSDGYGLLQTSVEHKGMAGVQSNYAQLFVTKDFDTWVLVNKWKKDRLPNRYFRHGVLMFADGLQTIDNFVLHGEALSKFDGKCILASIQTYDQYE